SCRRAVDSRESLVPPLNERHTSTAAFASSTSRCNYSVRALYRFCQVVRVATFSHPLPRGSQSHSSHEHLEILASGAIPRISIPSGTVTALIYHVEPTPKPGG